MVNPMLQMLNKQTQNLPQMQSPQMPNNPMQMMQQFAQFKQQMAGKDPKAMIDSMVKSGQISQEQLNGLVQTANALKGFMK